MPKFGVSPWKPFPFLRILLPLIAGILLQFHLQSTLYWYYLSAIPGLLLVLAVKFFTLPKLYVFRWLPGIGINLLFIGLGGILAINKNIENDKNWIGHHYKNSGEVAVTILEPLVEKPRSLKALASIGSIIENDRSVSVKGNMLLYFQKDSTIPPIKYGSELLLKTVLQPINNSGNPGGFDYKRYCAFQDIHYQSFLKPGDYILLSTTKTNWFDRWLIQTRSWVLHVLRKYIHNKNEVAVAEALLIGYRNDLDKELVQSYSNTGVVHIIAISGLHLGMIYGLLLWIFAPFKNKKWSKIVKPVTILFVLWLFTFIAGAVPSISRSAVMFTCIVLGESLGKKTSIYNTLAASAFLLLLYDPFYLWDVGFQLSYSAVLSIIVFQKYISNWFYFQNKILSGVWRLTAISVSAQVLTLPIVLYHFHQFPNLFLFTNLIVVPLSGLILFAEIFLIIVSIFPGIAGAFGIAVEWMINIMNTLIERTDRIPFAVTDGIQLSILQAIFIYGFIILISFWLIKKIKRSFTAALVSLTLYVALRSIDMIKVNGQKKLIVYNIPQNTAIDIIEGDTYHFYGDSSLLKDGFLRNFHLRPARIVNRVSAGKLSSVQIAGNYIRSNDRQILVISSPIQRNSSTQKIKVDAIIITANPRLYINELLQNFQFDLLVFDATNPAWKIRLWKKDCDSLHLRHYSVPDKGAFEVEL